MRKFILGLLIGICIVSIPLFIMKSKFERVKNNKVIVEPKPEIIQKSNILSSLKSKAWEDNYIIDTLPNGKAYISIFDTISIVYEYARTDFGNYDRYTLKINSNPFTYAYTSTFEDNDLNYLVNWMEWKYNKEIRKIKNKDRLLF